MPDSEYPVRKIVELPGAHGVTEIMFPDVSAPDVRVGVVSSQGDDHVAGVHVLYGGRHRLALLDADDVIAMARRLLQLAVSPDDNKRARAALTRAIATALQSGAMAVEVADRVLELFEIFPRNEG